MGLSNWFRSISGGGSGSRSSIGTGGTNPNQPNPNPNGGTNYEGGMSMNPMYYMGAQIAGAVYSDYRARKEADRNRNFQLSASNTSHQREVADLRAAGLNPILSANAGASTPSGATASTTDLSSMANTALDAQRVKQEFASIQSGIQLNQANATAAMAAKSQTIFRQGTTSCSNLVATSSIFGTSSQILLMNTSNTMNLNSGPYMYDIF